MKVGIILAALAVAMGNAYADGKEEAAQLKIYQELVKTPKPYDSGKTSIAWEAYGQSFYTSASSMSNPTLAKELFQRSAEYFEYAAHVNFKHAQDFNKDPKKSELYHRNAAEYFKKASISFEMAGDKINANKMKDKANEILIPLTEEHLATFVTPTAPGGKLQQTK
jgi:hypothetical protein